jgi:signal transduction histidine kinase
MEGVRATAAARLGRLRSLAARWPLPYAALAAVLFLEQDARQQGLTVLAAVLLVALCIPLAWQRDRPLEAFVAAMVLYVIASASPVDMSTNTAVFLVIFGPLFCVGRFEPPRRGLLGPIAAIVALPISAALEPPFDPSIFVTIPFFVLPTYLLGRVVRSRSVLVDELAEVNATIEREQAEAEAAAAASERARVARELHDVVAHALSVMVIQAAGARLAMARRPEASEAALAVVEEAGTEAVGEMRRLLGVLRDDDGPPAGLVRLDRIVARAREAGLRLDVAVDPATLSLPPTVDLAAFRIAQEAVTNAVKHAAPTAGRLSVRLDAGTVEVLVEDDGRPGGPRPGPGTGHGLRGLQERVELHGGELEAHPRRDGGFRVCARLPVA